MGYYSLVYLCLGFSVLHVYRFWWWGSAPCLMPGSVPLPSSTAKLTPYPRCVPWAWALCWMLCLSSVRSWALWGWSLMRWLSLWQWCWFLQVRKRLISLISVTTVTPDKSTNAVLTVSVILSHCFLLSSSDRSGISDMHAVEQLQEGLIRALRSLITRRRPDDTALFPKLLLRLPDLRTLNNLHSDKLLAFRIDPWEGSLLQEQPDINCLIQKYTVKMQTHREILSSKGRTSLKTGEQWIVQFETCFSEGEMRAVAIIHLIRYWSFCFML